MVECLLNIFLVALVSISGEGRNSRGMAIRSRVSVLLVAFLLNPGEGRNQYGMDIRNQVRWSRCGSGYTCRCPEGETVRYSAYEGLFGKVRNDC